MLKVVVFDCGYGGEFFADQLEEEIPIIEVIRVIDWRNANKIQSNSRSARKLATLALRPYLNKVDLIIFANHFLTITNLKYFERRYKNQKFLGLKLKQPDTFVKRDVLILATKPIAHTISYYNFLFQLKRKTKTLTLDDWPTKIDEGELSEIEIHETLSKLINPGEIKPEEIILACSHFSDVKQELKNYFGYNLKIYDGFDDAIRRTCKILHLRGGIGKKSK